MTAIAKVIARAILDSRGNPTVEVEVHCASGRWGRAAVPSGASTGRHEALELRDGDPAHYGGKGVQRAVAHVRTVIGPRLVGRDVSDQTGIDQLLCELDGTANKSHLGANAILGVSLACVHAAAACRGVPLYQHLADRRKVDGTEHAAQGSGDLACGGVAKLPLPMVNMISGGLHAGGQLEFQDFLLLPVGAGSYSAALEMAVHVYRELGRTLARHGHEADLVGDEGGYGPKLSSNRQAVELLLEAIERAGLKSGGDAAIAIDVASTHFYRDGAYNLEGRSLSSEEMIGRLADWVKQYPVWSIEDGLAEDDLDGWRNLTAELGSRVQLIGDDLFATNPARLERGIKEGMANSVLVKLNQIGTLTETLAVIRQAQAAGYAPVVSARSGETEDTTMADLAVATGAGQIKIGCIVRSERLAKYNQLLRIEEQLGARAVFAGRQILARVPKP
jgi:enolase